MNDTTPGINAQMREMIRAKSPIERLKMGCSMHATSKYLITQAILKQNPSISQIDLRYELFLKFYGDEFSSEEHKKILNHLENN